jgi:hypothetical protein
MPSLWLPSDPGLRQLERKASRIADPAKRLQYLKSQIESKRGAVEQAIRSRRRIWALTAAGLVLVVLRYSASAVGSALSAPALPMPERGVQGPAPASGSVWLVESTPAYETYSNGLRIERDGAVKTEPRRYPVYALGPGSLSVDRSTNQWRTLPAGIVFHTSESDLAPFDPSHNKNLRSQGTALVAYARAHRLYHYLIDRFGRVHRIVEESDRANHAGNSIWADGHWAYLHLNSSFLGVSFEAGTKPGQGKPETSPAQVHSGRILVEMLRAKHNFPAGNCVTHAQVSVNPQNFLIGYHTDWGGNFPFAALGLPDNYSLPLPSLWLFGFRYDSTFVKSTGGRMWQGLALAEEQLRQNAAAQGLSIPKHRSALAHRYREIARTYATPAATQEEKP